jgi:phosphonate dehydrogenase
VRRPHVLITHRPFPETVQLLAAHCAVDVNQTPDTLPAAELRTRAAEVDGLLVFMPDLIDSALLDACPRLRVVAAALKGDDNIDVAAAARRGITVSIVEDLLTEPTAELAVALLLAATRRVGEGDRLVRSGSFRGWRPTLYGLGLTGSTVGLLGFGAVGQAIARRLFAFDCQLLHADPVISDNQHGSRPVGIDDLFTRCDAVVVSAPLTPHTAGMVGAEQLTRLPAHAVLVNVGRGSVIDEDAVATALDRGSLGAYAADVFAFEDRARPERPPGIHEALRTQERTVFTPHLGSATTTARRSIERLAAENLLQVLAPN